jgi:hypothetical protein
VASITDPVDAPLAAPDVPAKPLEDPEEGVPAELPEDDPDPGLPEEGPLPLLLLHAAQKAVATIDKATGRLRALDMVVLREKKTRRCISREVGAGLADLRGTCAHVAGYARALRFYGTHQSRAAFKEPRIGAAAGQGRADSIMSGRAPRGLEAAIVLQTTFPCPKRRLRNRLQRPVARCLGQGGLR